MRPFLILGCLGCGLVGAYFGQPYIHGNSNAFTIMITVVTVFAGFLVAIITVLGDPTMIPDGSWRIAEMRRDNIENRLIRHLWLFVFYLLSIAALFVGVLVDQAPEVSLKVRECIERTYLFFFISSFLFTLGLPAALWKVQMARVEAEITRRRKLARISDD